MILMNAGSFEFCGANARESMNENECVQESLYFGISFKIHVVIYIYLYCDKNIAYTRLATGTAHTQYSTNKEAISCRL